MIAFPGSLAYALNHGVYLTDSQVLLLVQLSRPGIGVLFWSCVQGPAVLGICRPCGLEPEF